MSEFYCPQPWTGGFFTTEEQKVCCGHASVPSHRPSALYTHELVKNLRRTLLSGDIDKNCQRCKNDEDNGIKSLRKTHLDWHNDVGIDFEKDIDYPFTPKLFEVRLSNLCNYKCRMCTPNYSSSIDKEIKKNPHLKKWYTHQPDVTTDASHLSYQDDFLNDIIGMIPNIKAVHFTGGEPMLIPDLTIIIDTMDSQDYISDIVAYFTTNVSTINPKIFDKINKFKEVHFTLSIDGIEDSAEYMRDGTIWSKVNSNLDYYKELTLANPKIHLNINTVLNAYSVLTIDKTMEYLCELNHKCKTQLHMTMNTANLHFHPNVLTGDARKKAIDSLGKAVDILKSSSVPPFKIREPIEQISNMKNILETSEADEKANDFLQYTREVDIVRNQNFEKVYGITL